MPDPRLLLDPGAVSAVAPSMFVVRLETTQGDVDIDVDRALAPIGADRFYSLVKHGFYDDVAFFRVVAGFVAQAGLHGDPSVNKAWRDARIKDDPVRATNDRAAICLASSGPNGRTTQFFISLRNNARLDAMGFAPLGRARGLDVVERLYQGYGDGPPSGRGPKQSRIQREGHAYLRAEFPNLDYIKRAMILV
jgi:cyclophilin family peptidyl-prolyl cis-trans isomerase